MRLARAGGRVWESKEEAGSGLSLHPTGCGRVGCRPRAGCRNLPGRCWGHAPSLGRPLCAAAFPESPRQPCHLTQGYLGPQEGPRGSACCPRAPHAPSTCPRPTCPLLGTLGSGTSLSPSCSRDQPLLGGTGHGGQARWVAAHCPGFGVSCSRPDLASDAPRGPLMLACPWRGPAALISTSITMLGLSARLVKGLILSLLREPCEGW